MMTISKNGLASVLRWNEKLLPGALTFGESRHRSFYIFEALAFRFFRIDGMLKIRKYWQAFTVYATDIA